jgi:hypothetical protein
VWGASLCGSAAVTRWCCGLLLQADFIMNGSPNDLRMTWQFFEEQFLRMNPEAKGRLFERDVKYFDHFNLAPSAVSESVEMIVCRGGGRGRCRGWIVVGL